MEPIINFIQQTKYDDLSDETLSIIKMAFKDTIAVTLAAGEEAESRIVQEIVLERLNEPKKYSSVLETALHSQPGDYAFIIGTMSHVLDFDDVNFTFHGHPSVALIPIVLALSKEYQLTGKDMLTAYAIGFEVQARIGEAIGNEQYQAGYHTTVTLGIYGAVAAASKLLNFNEREIRYAFGLASSLAAGTRKNFGTMTKPLHTGFLAQNVYLICKLVAKGVTAANDIFSEPLSIDSITTGEKLDFSPLQKLGSEWELESFGIIFKKYPCCAFTHRSIDALLDIVNEARIDLLALEKIEAVVHYKVPTVLIYPEATTALEGKFSMHYCLAAAFLDKAITLESFTDDQINRHEVRTIMERVEMQIDPEQVEGTNPKEQEATIRVYTKDTVYEKTVQFPKGHPNNRFTERDMHGKFSTCVQDVMHREQKEKLYSVLEQLEDHTYEELEQLLISHESMAVNSVKEHINGLE